MKNARRPSEISVKILYQLQINIKQYKIISFQIGKSSLATRAMIVCSAFVRMASFPLSPTIRLLHPTKKEKLSSTFTKQQMASSGTTRPRGIVQQVTVPGMASPATTTHTLKLSCWLTTTWMVLFLQICGRSGT